MNRENFETFCQKIERQLRLQLPGNEAHLKMASRFRLDTLNRPRDLSKALKSAVLVLFYPDEEKIKLCFILRPDYNGVHSRQVAFPGGRWEEEDTDLTATALREAAEEVNIQPDDVTVLGHLTDLYIPPSNYLVTPVVGYSKNKPEFHPDHLEVAEIIETDLDFLFDPSRRKEKMINVRGYDIDAPYFDVKGHVIWGATAMILSELSEVIKSID
ncbi:MAG: CoA pyrophosphatase [Bacteroidetes bacterium]|nr:CoA pyrophosphatase [Bacteroidota bacterium]